MVDLQAVLEMTGKLLLAAVLGGVVGYERETHGRPAGLRTHILVCLGSALFTVASIEMAGMRWDPARVAAQIVSGIGFLGAGTILRQGSVIRGLTTAASLWTVAALGLSVGIGGEMVWVAVIASVIVFATLSIINRIEHRLISHSRYRDLILTLEGDRRSLTPILSLLNEQGIDIMGLESEEAREVGTSIFRLRLRFPAGLDMAPITNRLSALPLVRGLNWA